MKPLVLDFASVFLQVKNKGKYFWESENHQKGPTSLKVTICKPPTLTTKFIFRLA